MINVKTYLKLQASMLVSFSWNMETSFTEQNDCLI